MADAILDSSALLALINGERGADKVAALLDGAAIGAVNYAEVVTKIIERGASAEETRRELAGIEVPVISFDSSLAERTGTLRPDTRKFGLSLGDRACLALAEREGAAALTADTRWSEIGLKIKVQLIR